MQKQELDKYTRKNLGEFFLQSVGKAFPSKISGSYMQSYNTKKTDKHQRGRLGDIKSLSV